MPTRTVETKFWTENQNNSGGSFDHVPSHGIGYRLCVEATSKRDAELRMQQIIDNYPGRGYDCSCCGQRWSLWLYEEDGTEAPSNYGDVTNPLTGGWGIPSYIHYIDGTIESVAPSSN